MTGESEKKRAGRKPLPAGVGKGKFAHIRLDDAQHEKFHLVGGVSWFRTALALAELPAKRRPRKETPD